MHYREANDAELCRMIRGLLVAFTDMTVGPENLEKLLLAALEVLICYLSGKKVSSHGLGARGEGVVC